MQPSSFNNNNFQAYPVQPLITNPLNNQNNANFKQLFCKFISCLHRRDNVYYYNELLEIKNQILLDFDNKAEYSDLLQIIKNINWDSPKAPNFPPNKCYPQLNLPGGFEFKINHMNSPSHEFTTAGYIFNEVYSSFINVCFVNNNKELFLLLLEAHTAINWPEIRLSFKKNEDTTATIHLNIIAIALLFDKTEWLDGIGQSNMSLELLKNIPLELHTKKEDSLFYFTILSRMLESKERAEDFFLKFSPDILRTKVGYIIESLSETSDLGPDGPTITILKGITNVLPNYGILTQFVNNCINDPSASNIRILKEKFAAKVTSSSKLVDLQNNFTFAASLIESYLVKPNGGVLENVYKKLLSLRSKDGTPKNNNLSHQFYGMHCNLNTYGFKELDLALNLHMFAENLPLDEKTKNIISLIPVILESHSPVLLGFWDKQVTGLAQMFQLIFNQQALLIETIDRNALDINSFKSNLNPLINYLILICFSLEGQLLIDLLSQCCFLPNSSKSFSRISTWLIKIFSFYNETRFLWVLLDTRNIHIDHQGKAIQGPGPLPTVPSMEIESNDSFGKPSGAALLPTVNPNKVSTLFNPESGATIPFPQVPVHLAPVPIAKNPQEITPITPIDLASTQSADIPFEFSEWFKIPQNKQLYLHMLQNLGTLLKTCWFTHPSTHEWFVNQLIESKGVFQFQIEDLQTTQLFDPLVDFYISNSKTKGERFASTQAMHFIFRYFNFYNVSTEAMSYQKRVELASRILKGKEINHSNTKEMISYILTKIQKHTLGKDLSDRLSIEVAETLFNLKFIELMSLCKNYDYFRGLQAEQPSSIPCYLLTPDGENTRVELMMASFNKSKSLEGLVADFYGDAQKFLKTNSGLEKVISEESATLTLEQLQKLRECIASAEGFPTALILERKKRHHINEVEEIESSSSEEEKSTNSKTDAANTSNIEKTEHNKRPREENDKSVEGVSFFDHLLPQSKKIKTDQPQQKVNPQKRKALLIEGGAYHELNEARLTKKSHMASNAMEIDNENSVLPIAPSARLIPDDTLSLSPESMWKQLSLQSINSVEFLVASRKALKQALLNNKPLDYPVIELLNNYNQKIHKDYEICNSHLMGYQQKEVQNQLRCQEMNLSRLLAYTMGLGKTRVFLEMIAHWIAEKPGVNLLIVPYSLLEPTYEECLKFFGTVRSEALLIQCKQKKVDITLIGKAIASALKNKNPEELAFLLKTFSLFQPKILYDSLFDSGVYEKGHLEIWNGLTGTLKKHLAFLHESSSDNPEKYDRIVKKIAAALQEAQKTFKNFYWIKDLNLDENGIKQWLLNPNEQPFYPGCGLARIEKFHQPILHAQCMLAGALLNIGSEINENGKRFEGEASTRLCNFSPDKIKICSKPEDLDNFLNNGKADSSIVITTYGTASKAQLSNFNENTLASVVVDEAQKAHTADSKFFQWFSKLSAGIKQNQNKASTPSILLVTGTPFENNFTEMWNLLSLANPKGFPVSTHNALIKLADETLKSLVDAAKRPGEEDLYELAKQRIIQSFAQFEVFRKEIVFPLVCRAGMDDRDILRDWKNRVPVRKDKHIQGTLSEKAAEALNSIHQQYKTKKMNQFSYEHAIKRVLLHTDLQKGNFTESDPDIQNIQKLFESNNDGAKSDFIENSPYLNALLNSSKFKKFVENKEKGILFTEHVAAASILKQAIEHKYKENPPEIRIFKGSLSKEQRQELIKWFKEESDTQRILILMQEAGGVGLNLPEALKVFKMTINWNPAIDAQAIARAVRVGSEGVRKIYTVAFDIFFEHHCQAVQEEKLAWEEFFWSDTTDVIERFRIWCKLQASCCFHKYINDKKDKTSALIMKNAVESILGRLFNEMQERSLQNAVKLVTPNVIQLTSPQRASPPVERSNAISGTMPELIISKQVLNTLPQPLKVTDWAILPMRLCGPEPAQIQNSYNSAVKFGHFSLTEAKTLMPMVTSSLQKNPLWRESIRNGNFVDLEVANESKRDKSILQSCLDMAKETCSRDVNNDIFSKYTVEIYEFNGKENHYQCIKSINNGQKETIRLYKKTVPLRTGKIYYHYDVLLPCAGPKLEIRAKSPEKVKEYSPTTRFLKSKLIELVDDKGFKLEETIDDGDCFFDSVAKALFHIDNSNKEDVLSLRKKVLAEILTNDSTQQMVRRKRELRNKEQGDCGLEWDDYLESLKTTFATLKKDTAVGTGMKIEFGRPAIEGQVLADLYNMKINSLSVEFMNEFEAAQELQEGKTPEHFIDEDFSIKPQSGNYDFEITIANYPGHFMNCVKK